MLDTRFKEMLDILHAGGTHGYWWYRSAATNGKVSRWWNVGEPLPINESTQDVYYGIHPVNEIPPTNRNGEPVAPEAARSQIAYISAINCLFGEYDAKDYGTKEDALRHISAVTPRPSVLVDSGGGYHAYWLLDTTKELHNADDRAFMADVQARWVRLVGSDKASKDLARVLRVPGTHNHKYAPAPKVVFVWYELDAQYNLDELIAMLPAEEPKHLPAREVKATVASTDRLGAFLERALKDEVAEVVACADGLKHDTLRNAAVKIGTLIPHGLDYDRAFNMLHNAILGRAQDMRNADDTIEDGLRYGTQSPRDISHLSEREPIFRDGVACCPTHGTALVRSSNGNGWRCDKDAKCFWWKGEGYVPMKAASYSEDAQHIPEEKPRRKLVHGDDMANCVAPVEWLIPHVIPKRKLIQNFGMGGSGKSLLNLDLSLTLSNYVNVVYVAGEDESEYVARKEAWHLHYKADAPGFYFWPGAFSLLNQDEVDQFLSEVLPVEPAMIVFDPLINFMAGYDDSSTKDMNMAVGSLNRIMAATNATVLICHHTGWADSHERGSSVLRNACRMVMKTSNNEEFVTLSCEKMNGIKKFENRYFKMQEMSNGAPVMVPFDKKNAVGNTVSARHIAVLEALSLAVFRDGASFTQVVEHLQMAKSTLNHAFSRLMELGAVVKVGSGRGNEKYSISDRGKMILDRHNAGLNPSFAAVQSDSVHGFNWLVQSKTEPDMELGLNQTLNKHGTSIELGSGYRELDSYSSSIEETDSDAVVQSSSMPSSMVVQPTSSSSFNSASLEAETTNNGTEQNKSIDYAYLGGCYARGDMRAIEVHCAMRRLDKAVILARLEEMMAAPDEEDGF